MPTLLAQAVKRYTDMQATESPFATAIPGLTLLRSDHAKHPAHVIFKPALCVVAQGAKWTTFGDRRFDYGAGQALVVSVEMPALSRVVAASAQQPYLGVVIEFDLAVMSDVMHRIDTPPQAAAQVDRGVFVSDFDGPLADCVLRMVQLLDRPEAIAMLAPVIMREICYWLLTGPHGGEVARIALANGHTQKIIHAINVLRERFTAAMPIEELAAIAQLSPSAFHRQFKALTAMTPLQYQKQLRLLEARHLLVSGAANAETAAFQVGYESPSQFSREYARMFGAPPRRDIAALRAVAE
ncbi:AraC family transcriptional regulator N-terminal domain-containing protein [Sodalis sp. RH21]|uniref:AraC family transcriptional regulator n=1 Tax=unclassified Sodalis (in: enterobacteria) TaxID=2636512 RepID=UPI0039B6928C